ncbi:MAG: hypothetical protein Q8O62_13735 [Aequorivita sp.]|nr:hypothetical protein [Aequorivita sp.]
MSKYDGEISMVDVSDAIKEIVQEPLNTDFKTLTRNFLNYFIEDNCVTLTFQELREKYVTRFDAEDSEFFTVPEDEDEFYKEICKTYLFIEPNDPSNLKQKVQSIVGDLRKIEEDKSKYITQLEDLKNKEFEEGKNYKEKLLIHFIKKQEEAEAQILSYIKKNLSTEINLNKYRSLNSFQLYPDFTYHYNFSPHIYKLEYLSDIRNKLGNVVLGRYYELEKLFRTDKTKFLEELKKDFDLEDTINSIKDTVTKNKRLSQRKELIDDILELLKDSKTQLFCNVVPQQIEGILYDYCLEFGIEENSLKNSSLGDKINLLMEKGNSDVDYEYFAFTFPLIRNRVAHGKLIEQNLDLNSWLLLLDLKSSCEWLLSDKLPTNKNIHFINNLSDTISLVEFIKIAPIIQSGIDEFYSDTRGKLGNQKEALRTRLLETDFPYKEVKLENKETVLENLRVLKKIGLNDQECKKIIDKINCA